LQDTEQQKAFLSRKFGVIYGYARVSTDNQSVGAQVEQLRAAGCENVFRERTSGARGTDQAQLRRVLAQLCKRDRLARSKDQTTYCSIKLHRAGGSHASLARTRMSGRIPEMPPAATDGRLRFQSGPRQAVKWRCL
jgi:hypothetical protein